MQTERVYQFLYSTLSFLLFHCCFLLSFTLFSSFSFLWSISLSSLCFEILKTIWQRKRRSYSAHFLCSPYIVQISKLLFVFSTWVHKFEIFSHIIFFILQSLIWYILSKQKSFLAVSLHYLNKKFKWNASRFERS